MSLGITTFRPSGNAVSSTSVLQSQEPFTFLFTPVEGCLSVKGQLHGGVINMVTQGRVLGYGSALNNVRRKGTSISFGTGPCRYCNLPA